MSPFLSGVITWLHSKFPTAKPFPAPNNALSVRVNDTQYDMFFIGTVDDAMTAAASVRNMIKYPAVQKRVGVLVASSETVAQDPQIQSAVMSNYQADAVYLGYLTMTEVKKWPPSAP
jgi:hypothetical protein